jgi:hypothetical protein
MRSVLRRGPSSAVWGARAALRVRLKLVGTGIAGYTSEARGECRKDSDSLRGSRNVKNAGQASATAVLVLHCISKIIVDAQDTNIHGICTLRPASSALLPALTTRDTSDLASSQEKTGPRA